MSSSVPIGKMPDAQDSFARNNWNDPSVTAELVSSKTNPVTSIHNVFAVARVIKELIQNLNFLLHFGEYQ
jgi:hypothetical protein